MNTTDNTDNNTAIITRDAWEKLETMFFAYALLREERRSILVGKKNQAIIDFDENLAKKLISTIEAFDEKNPSTCDIRLTLDFSWDEYRKNNPIPTQEENA